MKDRIQTGLIFIWLYGGLGLIPANTQPMVLNEFEWIIGKWERTDIKAGQRAFEEWVPVSDVLYTGKGWTMEGQDTLFAENLRLFVYENKYFYEAEVAHNSSAVRFEIVAWSDTSFESVNPAHDFPTNIDYTYDASGKLIATISDQEKEIHFQFHKFIE